MPNLQGDSSRDKSGWSLRNWSPWNRKASVSHGWFQVVELYLKEYGSPIVLGKGFPRLCQVQPQGKMIRQGLKNERSDAKVLPWSFVLFICSISDVRFVTWLLLPIWVSIKRYPIYIEGHELQMSRKLVWVKVVTLAVPLPWKRCCVAQHNHCIPWLLGNYRPLKSQLCNKQTNSPPCGPASNDNALQVLWNTRTKASLWHGMDMICIYELNMVCCAKSMTHWILSDHKSRQKGFLAIHSSLLHFHSLFR